MLGDHLYSSHTPSSCTRQLVDAFQGVSLLALHLTPESDLHHFGCATGSWHGAMQQRLDLKLLVEKPTVQFAREHLRVAGLPVGEYLTPFGLYVISDPSIFGKIEAFGREGGLMQLTPALDQLRAECGLQGFLIEGERYDLGGDPSTYVRTLQALAKPGDCS